MSSLQRFSLLSCSIPSVLLFHGIEWLLRTLSSSSKISRESTSGLERSKSRARLLRVVVWRGTVARGTLSGEIQSGICGRIVEDTHSLPPRKSSPQIAKAATFNKGYQYLRTNVPWPDLHVCLFTEHDILTALADSYWIHSQALSLSLLNSHFDSGSCWRLASQM